jgi:hypothetical protein
MFHLNHVLNYLLLRRSPLTDLNLIRYIFGRPQRQLNNYSFNGSGPLLNKLNAAVMGIEV